MIVVDTNIIAYLHVSGKFTPMALQLLQKDSRWITPPLWQSEYRNLLMNYIRHDIMSLAEAIKLTEDALTTMLDREIAPSSKLVLTLATNSVLSAYDCEFVALADEANCKLITVDKQVIKNFPDIAISLETAIEQ
jgi:predicted nucleic acid-binding protein